MALVVCVNFFVRVVVAPLTWNVSTKVKIKQKLAN
jgi:hypothetical protein